jgi:iron(III) transport system permease protein
MPRLTLAILASVAWIGVQTFTEIPVSDAMMVRTFAEEVYVQLVHGESAVATAILATIPLGLVVAIIGWLLTRQLRHRMGEPSTEILPRTQQRSGFWPIIVAWLFTCVFILLPLGALAWKATSGGTGFSAIRDVLRTTGTSLVLSLFASLATGLIVAILAWIAVIYAMKSKWFMFILIAVSTWFLVLPGPILGLGLKESINILMDWESHFPLGEFPPMRSMLYDQSSPLPVMWAAGLRFFPLACLILWPAMRAIPRGLWEAAAIDGHTGWRLWKLVLIPHAGRAWLAAVVAVAALSLGEVSAGKLVNPPFYDVYILQLFSQMHYGTESSVAAMSLLPAFIVGILAVIWSRLYRDA